MDDANVPVCETALFLSLFLTEKLVIVVSTISWIPQLVSTLVSINVMLMKVGKTHPAYLATRRKMLSRGNPYFAAGKNFFGVG